MPQPETSNPSRSGKLEGVQRALATLAGVIGAITAVIGSLLALGVVHPFASGGPSVAQAAVTTIDRSTSSAKCDALFTVAGQSYPFTFSGTVDFALNRTQATYDFAQLSTLTRGQIRPSVAAFRDQDTIYVKRARPIRGKLWVKADDSLLFSSSDAGRLFAYTTSPAALLRSIRASSDVKVLGKESVVDGGNATHYRAMIDLRSVAAQAPPELDLQSAVNGFIAAGWQLRWPADVWVDDSGLIRETALAFDVKGSRMSAQCELSDFGTPFDATAPLPNEVQPVGSMQQLYAAFGSG